MHALSTIDLAMFMLESRERQFNIGPLILLRRAKGYRGNFANRLHDKLLERPVGAPFNYKLKLSLTSLPALVPVIATCVIVPVVNFVLLDRFVFKAGRS